MSLKGLGQKIASSVAISLIPALARGEYAYNLPQPSTELATQIYDLHTLILWVCLAIFIVVFGAMFYSIIKHRKAAGHKAANFHENTTVEFLWTVIPFAILIGMAYPASKTILAMKDPSGYDMSIKVTGYQWKWEYEHINEGVKYFSTLSTPGDQIVGTAKKGPHYLLEVDNPLVVPINKKVRVLITANDVLHAWWVPEFGVKQDAIPGFIKEAWFKTDKPGIYRGQCAELCGKDHAFMPIVVQAVSEADYATWLAGQKAKIAATAVDPNKVFTMDELRAQGEKVYAANCTACHQANGAGIPGNFPGLDGSKVTTGPIAAHIDITMHGKPGTAMPAFAKQLTDLEIAAVVTYERNAWSNKTGDLIQPAQITALRK